MKTSKEWAERLAEALTDEEFAEFAQFLDGCDDVEFSSEVTAIDEHRHPWRYEASSVEIAWMGENPVESEKADGKAD